jgi:hypothetical protein
MKNMTSFKRTVAAAAVTAALSISSTAFAGNNDGVLAGSIVDSSQMPVSGATVVAKDPKTGLTRTTTVKADGSYRFSALPVGNYVVTISKDGYNNVVQQNIRVKLGGKTEFSTPMSVVGSNIETIEISGTAMATIDTTSSETALNIGAVELSRLPVARDITSVALLAPGTTKGDSAFGNLASFGGSSVAENAYFVNGLNVSNFRNGLGGSTIPFEFYKEFQVKTGGYSAEFGRSTGGVINAVTKSGSNDFEYGFNVNYRPDAFRQERPVEYRTDGTVLDYNEAGSYDNVDLNMYVSGALIQDKLFYYVLYNPRNITSEWTNGLATRHYKSTQKDAFWGTKIDWNVTDNHLLELTAFSDKRETKRIESAYDYDAHKKGVSKDPVFFDRGGKNISVKYTGYITDDFTISALWGKNEADLTDRSAFDDTCPRVWDNRDENNKWIALGCAVNSYVNVGDDTREAFRIDGEWNLGDHVIRFGFDNEVNTAVALTKTSGGEYYQLRTAKAGETYESSIGYTFSEDKEYVFEYDYQTGGEFETVSNALYIEDTWTITDDITATIGIRSESFNNKNAAGESFIKIDNQIAPRLGITWDVNGDGESKLFANFGRYHLPVAANTNIRLAGAETQIYRFWEFEGLSNDEFQRPILGDQIGEKIYANGEQPDVRSVLDSSIKPMYQDELILGYQAMIDDSWSYGVKFTHRDLKSVIDDVTYVKAVRANGWHEPDSNVYILTNPGTDVTTYADTDGDGELEKVSISAEDMGYPEAIRKYNALDFNIKREWDEVWSLDATYTWAQSYGNAEGYVKSDNGQDDAGLTTDWDYPYLMDGAYGFLPNDRRHTFKVYGTYAITENLKAGFNLLVQSGRPISAFGDSLPDDYDENDKYGHGQTYYIRDEDGNHTRVTRGSMGRTPWLNQLNLNVRYDVEIAGADVELGATVYNVFGSQAVTSVDENTRSSGNRNKQFLRPTAYQEVRSAMLTASFRF